MSICRKIQPFLLIVCFGAGCALWDDSNPKKVAPMGLIATPASYYSTQKARYLGTRYKDNLDRLAERIVRNSNTSQLQFANNISSVGGIGFFTHSATKTPDERYLEVVLSTPDSFETKDEYSEKVNRLFSRFGSDLLAILAGDTQIYQDKELSGYGLNFTWRNVIADSTSNRVTMARAIIYFDKERVARFLRKEVGETELLSDAVIFAVEQDGPLNLISFQPREMRPDFRPAILEDNLTAGTTESNPPATSQVVKAPKPAVQAKLGAAQTEISRAPASKPLVAAEKAEIKTAPPVTAKKELPFAARSAEDSEFIAQPKLEAESLAPARSLGEASAVSSPPETQPQPVIALPQSTSPTVRSREPETNQLGKTKAGDSAATAKSLGKPPIEQNSPVKPSEIPKPQAQSTVSETAKPAPAVAGSKSPIELANTAKINATGEIKGQEAAPLSVAKLPAPAPVVEEKTVTPAQGVAQLASNEPVREPAPAPVNLTLREPEKAPMPSEPAVALASSSKPEEVARPRVGAVPALPAAKVDPFPQAKPPVEAAVKEAAVAKPLEIADLPIAPRTVEMAKTSPAPEPVATASTSEPIKAPPAKSSAVAALRLPVEKAPSVATEVTAAGALKPVQGQDAAAQVIGPATDKSLDPITAREIEQPSLEIATLPQAQPIEAPRPRSSVKMAENVAPALAAAKVEASPAAKPEVKSPIAAPFQENPGEKPEQLALLRKPSESPVEKPPVARPALKPLEGFIIQVAFNDKGKAQSWAEKMQQRGYAVSVTEAGPEGSLRVRLGNFAMRDEAERQLRNFKQDGLNGIIINLPQAFRPEARSSLP